MRGRVETKTTAATSPLSFCQSSAGRCSLCLSLFLSSSCHHPGDGPLDSFLIGKILSLLFFSVQPNKSRERERCLSRTGRNEEGNEYKSNQSALLVVWSVGIYIYLSCFTETLLLVKRKMRRQERKRFKWKESRMLKGRGKKKVCLVDTFVSSSFSANWLCPRLYGISLTSSKPHRQLLYTAGPSFSFIRRRPCCCCCFARDGQKSFGPMPAPYNPAWGRLYSGEAVFPVDFWLCLAPCPLLVWMSWVVCSSVTSFRVLPWRCLLLCPPPRHTRFSLARLHPAQRAREL